MQAQRPTLTTRNAPPHKSAPAQGDRSTPLSDARYQDLLAKAGAFFAASETDKDTRHLQVIDEILVTMREHGITVDDLA